MSQGIEPMTAAEYRREWPKSLEQGINGSRNILAALEEREANLAHARLGSLVAAIREHPMAASALRVSPKERRAYPFDDFWRLTEEGLTAALSHLDSLLPKEPEVVVKLGGRTWTFGTSPVGNTNVWWRPGDGTATVVASGELELALNALNALGGARGK